MTKNKLGLVVATKEYAFWKNSIDSVEVQVKETEGRLKWQKACLHMAQVKLLRCPKPIGMPEKKKKRPAGVD